jgi:hypothetical protein
VKLLATSAVQNTAATSGHGTSPGAHHTDDTGQPPVLDNKFVNHASDNDIEIYWTIFMEFWHCQSVDLFTLLEACGKIKFILKSSLDVL